MQNSLEPNCEGQTFKKVWPDLQFVPDPETTASECFYISNEAGILGKICISVKTGLEGRGTKGKMFSSDATLQWEVAGQGNRR